MFCYHVVINVYFGYLLCFDYIFGYKLMFYYIGTICHLMEILLKFINCFNTLIAKNEIQ